MFTLFLFILFMGYTKSYHVTSLFKDLPDGFCCCFPLVGFVTALTDLLDTCGGVRVVILLLLPSASFRFADSVENSGLK